METAASACMLQFHKRRLPASLPDFRPELAGSAGVIRFGREREVSGEPPELTVFLGVIRRAWAFVDSENLM